MHLRAVALVAALAWSSARAQDEYDSLPPEKGPDHLHITALGGILHDLRGSGDTYSYAGGEVAWAFEELDVGALVQGYRLGTRASQVWSPVLLLRILQRFETRRGVEATFGIGLGAGRTTHWIGWYQLALGMRLNEGPVFLMGELGFEQLDLFRLGAGLGVKF